MAGRPAPWWRWSTREGKEKAKTPKDGGNPGETNWPRVNRLTDREIERAAASDPDAAPIATADWFRQARLVEPRSKEAVSIRLDEDLIAWFKRRGRGYQTRINAVLRAYVEAHRTQGGRSRMPTAD
jgi:uncharacterized protein (DUF4415 family)